MISSGNALELGERVPISTRETLGLFPVPYAQICTFLTPWLILIAPKVSPRRRRSLLLLSTEDAGRKVSCCAPVGQPVKLLALDTHTVDCHWKVVSPLVTVTVTVVSTVGTPARIARTLTV